MVLISVCHGVEKQIMTLSTLGDIGKSAPGCECGMIMTGPRSEMRESCVLLTSSSSQANFHAYEHDFHHLLHASNYVVQQAFSSFSVLSH